MATMGVRDMQTKTEVQNKDDPAAIRVPGQNYIVFSVVSPNSEQTSNVCAIKVRGCFDRADDAKEHAALIQSYDSDFDVWVMDMWKWCPFPPNIMTEKVDMHYSEQQDSRLQMVMKHVNDEKTGRTNEFEKRMMDLETQRVYDYPQVQ